MTRVFREKVTETQTDIFAGTKAGYFGLYELKPV